MGGAGDRNSERIPLLGKAGMWVLGSYSFRLYYIIPLSPFTVVSPGQPEVNHVRNTVGNKAVNRLAVAQEDDVSIPY